jgi:hypothetical protein
MATACLDTESDATREIHSGGGVSQRDAREGQARPLRKSERFLEDAAKRFPTSSDLGHQLVFHVQSSKRTDLARPSVSLIRRTTSSKTARSSATSPGEETKTRTNRVGFGRGLADFFAMGEPHVYFEAFLRARSLMIPRI